jgi:DNA uptake protein ComE-like DNA-binding protein
MRPLRLLLTLLLLSLLAGSLPAQNPPATPKASAKAAQKAADKSAVAAGALVDINHATAAELKAIPGIGEAYSAAIIKGRPYANKAQLKTRNVVPDAVYEKIKDKIIAKQ